MDDTTRPLLLDKRDAHALLKLADTLTTDLGSVDFADSPELQHLSELRTRIAALHGEPDAEPVRFTSVFVGSVANADNGFDAHYILTVNADDDAPTQDRMQEQFRAGVWQESSGHGTRYCTSVTVAPVPHTEGMKWFAIARVRWDV